MAGVRLPLLQEGRERCSWHRALEVSCEMAEEADVSDSDCCLLWPLSSVMAEGLAFHGSGVARAGCLRDSPGCLLCQGMAYFACSSL